MASLLDEKIKNQVREFLVDLSHPVEIIFFGSDTDHCEYCQDTQELLEEVVSLHDQVSIKVYDLVNDKEIALKYNMDKAPSFAILGRDENDLIDYGIRYAGIPAGHEFTSLINDILIVSKRESGLSNETRQALSEINTPIRLQVFVTPTCPYCPRAVVLAHQMAMESPYIQAEMVEAMEFNELANQYGVSGVPHTIINEGTSEVVGAVPEGHLLQKIQEVLSLA